MSLSLVGYRRLQLQQNMHTHGYRAFVRLTKHALDMGQTPCTDQKERFNQSIKLGAVNGLRQGLRGLLEPSRVKISPYPWADHLASELCIIFVAAACVNFVMPAWVGLGIARATLYMATLIGVSYGSLGCLWAGQAACLLALRLGLGSGVASSYARHHSHTGAKTLAKLSQYGLIGLSELALLRAGQTLYRSQWHTAASNCVVSAMLLCFILEVGRTGLALVTKAPLLLAGSLLAVAVGCTAGVLSHAIHPHRQPLKGSLWAKDLHDLDKNIMSKEQQETNSLALKKRVKNLWQTLAPAMKCAEKEYNEPIDLEYLPVSPHEMILLLHDATARLGQATSTLRDIKFRRDLRLWLEQNLKHSESHGVVVSQILQRQLFIKRDLLDNLSLDRLHGSITAPADTCLLAEACADFLDHTCTFLRTIGYDAKRARNVRFEEL